MKARLSEMAEVEINEHVMIKTRTMKEHHFGSAQNMLLEKDEALKLADKIKEELGDDDE